MNGTSSLSTVLSATRSPLATRAPGMATAIPLPGKCFLYRGEQVRLESFGVAVSQTVRPNGLGACTALSERSGRRFERQDVQPGPPRSRSEHAVFAESPRGRHRVSTVPSG